MRLYLRFFLLMMYGMLTTVSMPAQEEQRIFYSFDASDGLADNSAQTLKCTKTGRIVITTIGHVNFYDGATFSHIDPKPEDAFPLPKYNGHYHLYFDLHHHLWLKDKYSVTCVNLLTEQFIRNVSDVIKKLGMSKHVDDLFCDQDCHMWFLSEKELHGTDDHLTVPVSQHAELQDIDVYNHQHLLQIIHHPQTDIEKNCLVLLYGMESGECALDYFMVDAEGNALNFNIADPYSSEHYAYGLN